MGNYRWIKFFQGVKTTNQNIDVASGATIGHSLNLPHLSCKLKLRKDQYQHGIFTYS